MLDMGFEPEIKKILLDIRPDRQTIMTRQVKSICFSRASFLKQIQCMWVVARQSDRNTNNSRQRQTAAIVVHQCCQRLYYSDFYALSLYKCHITLFYFGYSATWPKGVQRMADQYLKNPVRVFVGSLDLNVSTYKIQYVFL